MKVVLLSSVFAGFITFYFLTNSPEPFASGTTFFKNHTSDTSFKPIIKIPIDAARWYILNHAPKGIGALFNGETKESVQTGFPDFRQSYDCIYPLEKGESISISHIKMYDGAGDFSKAPAKLFAIRNDGSKCLLATFDGSKYNEWVGPYLPEKKTGIEKFSLDTIVANISYLVINCSRNNLPTEIELYGNYTAPDAAPMFTPTKFSPFNHSLGMNGFEWDFINPSIGTRQIAEDKYKAISNFKGFRHYLDWSRLEDVEGNFTFNPCHYGGFDYDMTYERCKRDGIEVLVCLKNIPMWMQKTYPANQQATDNLPLKYSLPRDLPSSYIEKGRLAFQFAARYGRNKNVPLIFIKVDTKPRWKADKPGTLKTGMNLIKYIECGNELNKWWRGANGYMDCYEYAALLSAFYDGHKGQLGKDVGVKNADPSMQVVMGGLAMANTAYVRGMVEWCRQHRGYKTDGKVDLCWDVINYHHYSNNASIADGGIVTSGASPEIGRVDSVAKSFVNFSKKYSYGMPVWVSELGYDINPGSLQKAIAIGDNTALQTQADWILRSALVNLREGIDRTFFYELKDFNFYNPVKYGSMGLTDSLYQRRPALDYLYQTNLLMGNFCFEKNINQFPIVDKYAFKNKAIYVVWMPTQQGLSKSCSLPFSNTDSVILFQPQAGKDFFHTQTIAVNKGMVNIVATETPQFVAAKMN